jgi:hypothetical protein
VSTYFTRALLHMLTTASGTTQKRRIDRPMSAIEGNPDIHRRCAEGPRLTHSRLRSETVSSHCPLAWFPPMQRHLFDPTPVSAADLCRGEVGPLNRALFCPDNCGIV